MPQANHRLGSFKGRPTITLDPEGKYPFSFGAAKAALIVLNFEAIKAFAEANDQPERQPSRRLNPSGNCHCEDWPCCGH